MLDALKRFWPKKQMDPARTYLRVEFLTAEEKARKKLRISQLEKEYMNDNESIIPYQGAFSTSYKFIMNSTEIGSLEPILEKMILKELTCHLQVTKDQNLEEFMATYVKEIQIYMFNQETVDRNYVLPLFDQSEASIYTPSQVLEIIYEPKSLWERLKSRGKKFVKAIPSSFLGLVGKLVALILSSFGLGNGMKSLIWKMLPTTSVLQWFISALTIFFPFLGPLLNLGTRFLL